MEAKDRLKDKYIDPFTDFGFKKLFGEECNKDLLLDFLNELLHKNEGKIVSLSYMKGEQLGRSEDDRKAIFDLFCENEKGEKFIVEMQKTKQIRKITDLTIEEIENHIIHINNRNTRHCELAKQSRKNTMDCFASSQ